MKIRTKAVSLLLTVLLVFGVYAIVPPAAFAEEIIEVTAETDYFTDGNTYRVSQDVTNDKRIRIQGSAVLTLDEGVTLTLNKGIQVSENNSLTIRGAGKLIANAEKNNAAIGSGESQKNGAITIESGEIIATGGEFAAGIGGGRYSQKGSAIKISGGKITATGQTCSAGIGGGTNNNWEGHYGCVGDITITGGEVTANGIGGGAGIGGGGTTFNGVESGSYGGNVGTITIIGGKVTATGGEQGFGIGPGMNTDLVSSNIDQIILGWTQKSDFIEASSFGDDADKIAFFERQTLYIAGTARTATAENILNGCKLIPERDEKDYSLVYAEVGNVESRYYYTGADIAITPVITDYNGNVLLADDYDTVLKRGGEVVAAANELGSYTCTFEGKGDYKDSITFDFEVVTQPAPTLQATDLKESTARLCWEDESAATNWVVEYGTDDIFTEAQSITVAGTTAVTLDIQPETTYYARVKSVIGAVESEWSNSISFAFSDKRTIDGETHDTAGLPSKLNYGYTLSQQIYTSEELGGEAVITSVGFFLQSDEESDPVERQLDIYLLSTENEKFTENQWIPYTEDDKVFSGAVSFRINDWTDIVLDTPFAYNGAGNIAVIVFDRTNRKEAGYSFRVFGTDQPMSINCFADSAFDPSPDNDKYLLNKKSVTRLGVQKPIAIDGNISNGTLSADKEFAAAGETVTLDVQPDENYEIGEAGFTDGSGYHKITPEDGVYSFTMPNSSVTAKASFNKITYPYVDAHGRARGPVSEYEVVKKDTTELTEGFWIVNSNVTNKNRLTVNGNVKLILCDGAELTAPEGITVNYDDENENTNLTIFGQSAGTGRLTIEKPTTVRRTPL